MVNDNLTAGEFQAMTGLTAKALRLYAERDIVTPASVDPVSGYRTYTRAQLQHGMTVDLLRRAQVPLSELVSASDFSFAQWRQTVELRRHLEDFYLETAEQVAAFDPEDLTAQSTLAPAVDWIGVIIDLDVPDDIEGRLGAFTELAVVTPAVETAFAEALERLGEGPAEVSWTVAPEQSSKNGKPQLLLARPGPVRLERASQDLIAGRVHSSTGQSIAVVSGTLPRRVEVTFSATTTRKLTAVEEAAAGYLHALAFEEHIGQHDLTPIRSTARMVTRGNTIFPDDAAAGPTSVFDVHPAAREHSTA